MPAPSSYDYAIIRVVPHVERGEYINAGIILYCPEQRYLGAVTHLNEARLLALAPDVDLEAVYGQLAMITLTSQGAAPTGSIGRMSVSERYHWLVAPRSTIVQTSPVHCGLCSEPASAMQHLLQKLVLLEK